jgi:hypothetical protein
MLHAIERCDDRVLLGELYAELAVEAATRSGIWAQVPDNDRVQGWIDRALELSPPGTPARAQALIALCFWQPDRPAWAAEELDGLTRSLEDPWLRIRGLNALWLREFGAGRYQEGLALMREAFDAEGNATDPNVRAELREASIPLFALCGLVIEARRLLGEYDEAAERLSPHHRMHGAALAVELGELAGDWDALRGLTERVRSAVADNLATPCVRNSRSLLMCAAAAAAMGDEAGSLALDTEAQALASEGYELILRAPRIRLALARGDLDAVEGLLVAPNVGRGSMWSYANDVAAYLDGLAAVGDPERVEREAPAYVELPSALEPFALRALGMVRRDAELLVRAADRFAELDFDRQGSVTRAESERAT